MTECASGGVNAAALRCTRSKAQSVRTRFLARPGVALRGWAVREARSARMSEASKRRRCADGLGK
eukprot:14708848-Alexandrium_andersonii.AAC.1